MEATMTAKHLTAHQRIQNGMLTNERLLLAAIRKANRKGDGWQMYAVARIATYNAMERLQNKGLVICNTRGSWHNTRRGYWTTTEWLRANA
jgi:hypothetical protein